MLLTTLPKNTSMGLPTYLCTIKSGTTVILEGDKCSEIGCFAPDEAPADLTQMKRENL
jgi:hypothetical protein